MNNMKIKYLVPFCGIYIAYFLLISISDFCRISHSADIENALFFFLNILFMSFIMLVWLKALYRINNQFTLFIAWLIMQTLCIISIFISGMNATNLYEVTTSIQQSVFGFSCNTYYNELLFLLYGGTAIVSIRYFSSKHSWVYDIAFLLNYILLTYIILHTYEDLYAEMRIFQPMILLSLTSILLLALFWKYRLKDKQHDDHVSKPLIVGSFAGLVVLNLYALYSAWNAFRIYNWNSGVPDNWGKYAQTFYRAFDSKTTFIIMTLTICIIITILLSDMYIYWNIRKQPELSYVKWLLLFAFVYLVFYSIQTILNIRLIQTFNENEASWYILFDFSHIGICLQGIFLAASTLCQKAKTRRRK